VSDSFEVRHESRVTVTSRAEPARVVGTDRNAAGAGSSGVVVPSPSFAGAPVAAALRSVDGGSHRSPRIARS